jgi:hypothetical protein
LERIGDETAARKMQEIIIIDTEDKLAATFGSIEMSPPSADIIRDWGCMMILKPIRVNEHKEDQGKDSNAD